MEWISVKDRLPESAPARWSKDVIAMSDTGEVFRLACNGEYWQRTMSFINSDSMKITHWVPMPEFSKDQP